MEEERIMNEEVRKRLKDIPQVKDFIGRFILRFLGKLTRADDSKLQKKMLNAWVPILRKSGAPQKML